MSITSRTRVVTAATALAAATALVGCQTSGHDHGPSASAEVSPLPEAQPAAATIAPSEAQPERTAENRMYFPTGDQSTSVLLVEKTGPAQVRLNKEYTYQIKVTNLTDATLHGVTLQESLPGSFNVSQQGGRQSAAADNATADQAAAQPAAATVAPSNAPANAPADHAAMGMTPHSYSIGDLGPKESKTITVTGTPTQAGKLESCLSATYSPTLCTTAMVTNPQLKITKEAVSAAGGDICQPQTLRYSLTNTGTGTLTGVHVDDTLANGLMTSDGTNRVYFTVGTLAEGQTRTFDVTVKPQHAGQFSSMASASADDGVTAKSEAVALNAKAPKLQVMVKAPEKEYLGQQVKYQVSVKNVGDAPARSPSVQVAMAGEGAPGEAQTAAAIEGTQDLGEIAPGDTKTITIPVAARTEGELKLNATASDPCAGQAVMASGQTNVTGIPALLLSAVDDHDPVRVGDNVVYTITVLNQGFGTDKDIHVLATLPDGLQYVSSTGPSKATVEGTKVNFAPVSALSAKQELKWTITAKALNASDVKFRVDLNSKTYPDAATKIETTRLY